MQINSILLFIVILSCLLVACQSTSGPIPVSPEPSSTSLPPTSTFTPLPPTHTPLPPTSIFTLTQTSIPTPVYRVKSLIEWADLHTGKGPVYSQDWSSDGVLLVTADTDQILVWDVDSRTQAGVLTGHTSYVWGIKWSPVSQDNQRILASASQDGTVRLWDVATMVEITSLQTGWAFCLDWSLDGKLLAVGTMDGEVQIWDINSLSRLRTLRSQTHSPIISLAWSPDGESIASGELSGEIYLWDAKNFQLRQSIQDYAFTRSDTNGLAWSPDGNTLASAHQDGQVRLWDGETGALVLEFRAHTGWVRGIAWSPDGNLLATTGEDKRICLWDPITGLEYAEQHHNSLPVWSVSWSPDGTKIASGAGGYNQKHTGATIVWRVPYSS